MAVGEKEHEAAVVESDGKTDSDVVSSADFGGEKKKMKSKGLFSRLWNAIFRVRGDDFEKRLKGISKEEATIRNRMKRRSITRRRFIRNLIVFSVFFEIITVAYAIMTTRNEDLDWKLRSFRILPMFGIKKEKNLVAEMVVMEDEEAGLLDEVGSVVIISGMKHNRFKTLPP